MNQAIEIKEAIKKPLLPAGFTEASTLETFAVAVYGWALWLVPAYLAYMLCFSEANIALKIITSAILMWFSGYGMMIHGLLGHDGIHQNLHKSKVASMYLGMFFSSMIFLFIANAFGIRHWKHHRYTNTEKDPDVQFFGQYKSFITRLFIARLQFNHEQMDINMKLAFKKELDGELLGPFKMEQISKFAKYNLVFQLFWITLYLSLAFYDWQLFLFLVVIPHLFVLCISGIQPFQEHVGTDQGQWTNSRTLTSWLWTAVMAGNNYHLEHHLYPNVPGWRLPKVHRFLVENRKIDSSMVIEKGFFAGLTFGSSRYNYPDGNG